MSNEKARPGQPLRFPAHVYNDMRDMLRWWKNSVRADRKSSKRKITDRHNQTRTVVLNRTGVDIARFEVFRFGAENQAVEVSDYMKESLLYGVAYEQGSKNDTVGVALEPIAEGSTGLACLIGVCVAWVDVTDDDHTRCMPGPQTTNLVSSRAGRFPIIYKLDADASGVQKCLVSLSGDTGGFVFPVVLEKSSGEEGDATTKCSFKYNVFSLQEDGISKGEQLASGSDPLSGAQGLYQRSDLGKYKEADYGLAMWVDFSTSVSIIWCNEVYHTTSCSASDADDDGGGGGISPIIFGGDYDDTKSYSKNTLVLDSGFQMVAQTTTRERPAPQPIGEPTTKLGTLPTFANISGPGLEVITGQRYTWASGGMLAKVKAYVPTTSGVQYEVWLIQNSTSSAPIIRQLVSRFTADSTGWKEFPIVQLFKSGVVFDVLLVTTRSASSSSFSASWNYQSNTTDPAAGYAHHHPNGKTLKINHSDNGTTDRETALEAMKTGDTITLGTTVWTIAKTTAGSSVHTFEVLPQTQHGTKGVGSFDFKAITSGTIDYITKSGHFSGDSEVQGLLSTTGYSNVATSNDAFGVDIEYQPMSVSSDWDLLAYNGDTLGEV